MYTWTLVFLLCSWKIETISISEMKISKVTDYAALKVDKIYYVLCSACKYFKEKT